MLDFAYHNFSAESLSGSDHEACEREKIMKLWSGMVITVGIFLFVIGLEENFLLIPASVLIAGGTVAMSISGLNDDDAKRVGNKPKESN